MTLDMTNPHIPWLADVLKDLADAGYQSISLTLVDDCQIYDSMVIGPGGAPYHGLEELPMGPRKRDFVRLGDIAIILCASEPDDESGEWIIDLTAGTITHTSTAYTETTLVASPLATPEVTRLTWSAQSDNPPTQETL